MKIILYFATAVLFLIADLAGIRKQFQSAHQNQEQAKMFYQRTEKISQTDAASQAYKAAAKMILSKYEKNRAPKKELFKSGALRLNELIEANPNNVEIRFIRLTIQQNTPAILKYNANITEDKHYVLTQYKNCDAQLQPYIKQYIINSPKFNQAEKNSLM